MQAHCRKQQQEQKTQQQQTPQAEMQLAMLTGLHHAPRQPQPLLLMVLFAACLLRGSGDMRVALADHGRELVQRVARNAQQLIARPDIIVARDGSGNFTTVREAIANVPPAFLPSQGTVVYVKAGVYNEVVIVKAYQRYLTMIGDPGQSTVQCSLYNGAVNANGDTLSTLNTACFLVLADDFTCINMVFRNAVPRPPPNTYIYQAVAVRVTANRTIFFNTSFYSFQDTVYAHKGWQYYYQCYFFGSVDFIFGYAKAIFDDCTMEMTSLGFAAVTAQYKRRIWEDNCYVIINSRVISAPQPNGQGWLGRSWGQYACTIFANTYMDEVVSPDGWNDFFALSRTNTSFYAEWNNTGIGANMEGRVEWMKVMTPQQRAFYLSTNWISLRTWQRAIKAVPALHPSPPPSPPTTPTQWQLHQEDRPGVELQLVRTQNCLPQLLPQAHPSP